MGESRLVAGVLFGQMDDDFAYTTDELFRSHLAQTDIELVLHVEQPIYPLPAHLDHPWVPSELATLLPTLPAEAPLGIYGRGPTWLYAALAAAHPAVRCAVFDPRQGWVDVPTLSHAPLDEPGPLDSTSTTQNGVTRLRAGIPSGYLDWRDAARIAVPAVAGGVILDGRLPTGCGRRWRGGITRRRGWRATNRNSAARCLSARTMPASPLGMCCPMI